MGGLLADLNDCSADLRHELDFQMKGSKKMACMQGAHMKQRACYGQSFSAQYANKKMAFMKMECQAEVKDGGNQSSLGRLNGYVASNLGQPSPSQPAGEPSPSQPPVACCQSAPGAVSGPADVTGASAA